jgi:hypothetical protein
LFPVLLLFAVNAVASVVPPATPGAPASREEVRKQLAAFFAGGGLGDLKKSPGLEEAVQKRINAMSDDELSSFQKLIAGTPNWRSLPQAVSAAIPAEVKKSVERAAADLTTQVSEAERMRDDVRTLAAVLRLLPDQKLKELGLDRRMLGSLDGVLSDLAPLQVAMLQKQLAGVSTWNETSAKAMAALPPEVRRGALALAKHGPLTDDDRKSLEQFRADLAGLLRMVQALPPAVIPSVDAKQLQNRIDHISLATPEALFMLREEVPPAEMSALREKVAVLDRAAHLSGRESAALETFRAEVVETFGPLQPEGTPDDLVRDRLAKLEPGQLLMLQAKLTSIPAWQEIMPVYYRTFSGPGLAARIAAVRGPAPDPARVAELQAFRAQALQYIQASAGAEGVDAALVQKASLAVENADPPRLELIRSLAEKMGGIKPASRLKVVAQSLDLDLDFNCSIDLDVIGTVSFNFLCSPIRSVFRAVEKAINSVVDDLTDRVKDIASSVDHIVARVDQIRSSIQDIPDLAWGAISKALHDLLKVNIRGGFNLDEMLHLDYKLAVIEMRASLHLTSHWWESLSVETIPSLACPPIGTQTPFGATGTGEALAKFKRYDFFVKKLMDLIPDTELSLEIKIPAQIAFGLYEFTGVCLEEAAGIEDGNLLTSRHGELTTGISNLSSQVTTTTGNLTSQVAATTSNLSTQVAATSGNLSSQVAATTGNLSSQVATTTSALSVQLTNSFNNLTTNGSGQMASLTASVAAAQTALSNQLTGSTASLTASVTAAQTALSNQLTGSTTSLTASVAAAQTALSNQLTTTTNTLTNKIDTAAAAQRSLDLRLQIEGNLQAGGTLAMFQVPAANGGYLELVRDTVNSAITSMLAAGQTINQAQKYFNDAQTAISQARYKDAFKSLQTAYGQLTAK